MTSKNEQTGRFGGLGSSHQDYEHSGKDHQPTGHKGGGERDRHHTHTGERS